MNLQLVLRMHLHFQNLLLHRLLLIQAHHPLFILTQLRLLMDPALIHHQLPPIHLLHVQQTNQVTIVSLAKIKFQKYALATLSYLLNMIIYASEFENASEKYVYVTSFNILRTHFGVSQKMQFHQACKCLQKVTKLRKFFFLNTSIELLWSI